MSSGLRELVAENKRSARAAGGLLLIVAVLSLGYQLFWHPRSSRTPGPAYYTTDDGATWFIDTEDRITPFTTDVGTGVRARVFRCKQGDFTGYLERASSEAGAMARKLLETARVRGEAESARGDIAALLQSSAEVKHPGPGGQWIPKSSPEAQALIHHVKCPKDPSETPEPVEP